MKSPNQSKILIFQGIRSQAWVRLNLTQILSNIPKHPLPSPIKLKLFSSSTDKIIAASNLEFRIEQKQLNFMLRSKIISTIMIWVRRTKALRERKRKWVTSNHNKRYANISGLSLQFWRIPMNNFLHNLQNIRKHRLKRR